MSKGKSIAALSVAAPELTVIRQLFERVRGRLAQPWQWAQAEAEADVLLIDVDSVYGHMDWLRANAAGRRIISLTNRPSTDDETVLRRPISADGLIAALQRFEFATAKPDAPAKTGRAAATPRPAPAASKSAAAPAYAAPPQAAAAPPARTAAEAQSGVDANAPRRAAPRPEPAAEPPVPSRPSMLADFLNPTTLPGPARLARGNTPALTVDAANDCWYGPSSLKLLLPYCSGPVDKTAWTPVSAAVMEGLRAAGGAQPLTRLLWLIALANSGGQLATGLSPNARYRLARWPQIEREFPKHFRIATVMMKGWATLTEISEHAGAALTEVIDFVNAYFVSGHAEVEPEATTASSAPLPTTPMARLARLLRSPIGG